MGRTQVRGLKVLATRESGLRKGITKPRVGNMGIPCFLFQISFRRAFSSSTRKHDEGSDIRNQTQTCQGQSYERQGISVTLRQMQFL